MAKQKVGKQKKEWKFDAAGWLFWTVLFVVLIVPSIFLGRLMVYEDTSATIWVGFGIVIAAVGAGMISWAVNEVIQRRRKRQRLAERKKLKKQQR